LSNPVLFHIPAELSSANIPEWNFSRSRQLKVIFVMEAAEDCPCGDAIASRKPVEARRHGQKTIDEKSREEI
jgi:hypothetical protein